MAPPAKRRKRNTVHSSDDDDEESKPKSTQTTLFTSFLFSSPDQKASSAANGSREASASPSPARKSTLSASTQSVKPPSGSLLQGTRNRVNKNGYKSASTSPEKGKLRTALAKGKLEEKGKTADLKSLFSKQAERAPTASTTKLDDILSDPISEDDEIGDHRAVSGSKTGQNARKRSLQVAPPSNTAPVALGQRFLRPPKPPQDPSLDNEQRPWAERFGPANLGELAVHKKKVADVRRWLEDVMGGRMRQRLLILKGAAGTGKTTTVRLLAKDMGCELLEWRNPAGSLGSNQGFMSASAQFMDFMGRGGKFGQLDTGLGEPAASHQPSHPTIQSAQRIILIEEFPNTFTRSSTALDSFRKTVLQYLATNTPSLSAFSLQKSKESITPIVMVISETLLTTTSASADSFTAHRLLGPEISRHPGTGIIEFNAIAPTLLTAALELVVQKEARKSGRRRTPGPLVLKHLGEIGDIRSAVSSLEFLCLKGDNDAEWGARIAFTKPKRGSKSGVPLTKGEQESLELISQREASLGIFHAVGKVVYNKRDETPAAEPSPASRAEILPDYLAAAARPKRSQVFVDSLIDEIGTDTHTFISALHENYALSCEATGPQDPNSSLDYLNGCLEYLSDSDLLSPSWDNFFGGRGKGTSFSGRDSASHALRQDEITFQVAARGLLFSLPCPVKRSSTTSGRGGGDAFKMFYPTSLKLWREKEELEGMVDYWATRLLKGEEANQDLTDGASAFRRPKPTSGGNWVAKQVSQRADPRAKKPEQMHEQAPPLLSLGSSARKEMLLERLPYMAHIARGRKTALSSVRLRDLNKIVSFSGISSAGDEDDADGDDAAPGEEWATDKPTEESSPRKKSLGIRHKSDASVSALPVQRLVLSDDDIEDD